MKVSIVANGVLQFIISDPQGRVQDAAMETMTAALKNSQQPSIKASEDGRSLIVSVEA